MDMWNKEDPANKAVKIQSQKQKDLKHSFDEFKKYTDSRKFYHSFKVSKTH